MGFFDLFKKKVDYAAQLKDVSLREMANVIGWGVHDKTAKSTNPELAKNYSLYSVYFKRLVYSSVSEGGFGGDPNINYDPDRCLMISVETDGAYSRINAYGKELIINYKLQYLKNYIKTGNTIPLKKAWIDVIFNVFNDENSSLNEKDIINKNHYIYNQWVYTGDDNFILYKIKLAISLSNPDFLREWGLFRPGVDGPSDEYITIDDVIKFNNQGDLAFYLDSIQTNFE